MSTKEKLSILDSQKGSYLNDVWNSLFDPDIIRTIDEDNLTIKAIIMLLETAVRSVKSVSKELKEAESEKESLLKSLQAIRTDNEILKRPCRQCPELQKKLTEQVKKTKDCKRSIQSIFALLKPMTENNGEDTQKAALLETQTIMGKYISEDNDIIPETPGCSTKTRVVLTNKSDQLKYQSELKKCSVEEQYNCSIERVTPKKENGKRTPAGVSPVLKSAKRTIKFNVSQEKSSPDKSQKKTESQPRCQPGNSSKLEWNLRAGDTGSKQATLSVKARPRADTKRDLSMMEGFSGGTLASSRADESDDCIATSPDVEASRLSGLSLNKKRPRTSKEKVDDDDQMPAIMTLDETHFVPMAASTCQVDQDEKKQKKNPSASLKKTASPLKLLPASSSRKHQTAANPVFKYERGAVKKKSERLKLDGWSCDDCEKYYANMEKAGMNASHIKRTMNKCSRHRNQFQRPNTPPDFWNPKFDTSDEDDD